MTDFDPLDDFAEDFGAPLSPAQKERVRERLMRLNEDPVRIDVGDREVVDFTERQFGRIIGDDGQPVRKDFERFRPSVGPNDLFLFGSVGDDADNAPEDVFKVKKLLQRAASAEFRPGIEGLGEADPRTVNTLRNIQGTNNLKVDGRVEPGGPTLHALGFGALGPEHGRPTPLAAHEFETRFGKSADRDEQGRPIAVASNRDSSRPAFRDVRAVASERDAHPATEIAGQNEKPATPGSLITRQEATKEQQARKRKAAEKLARVVKIDPALVRAASDREVAVIIGIVGYRHLDRFQRIAVNTELERMKRTHTLLYRELAKLRAFILVQPNWVVASLSPAELQAGARQKRAVANFISIFGDFENIRTAADMRLAIARAAPKTAMKSAMGGVAVSLILWAVADGMRKKAKEMERELERRAGKRN